MTEPASSIDVVFTALPLERVDSDVAVAGFFTDERPLRGGAARVDWRLCGGVSRRIESGDLSGRSGEAMLIACGRALRAPRLMLLGLGDRSDYDRQRVSDETRDALERCRKLGVGRVALAPLGIAPDDLPRHAAAILSAIAGAWSKVPDPMGLAICVPRTEIAGVTRAFESAREAAGEAGMRLRADEESLALR